MISFIILHYKNISDTVECIESINKLYDKNVSIIVVDNNTLTKEDEDTLNKYDIDLIKNDSNLGYAKANNIGASFAIKKYHPSFIAVINNDTVIKDKNFTNIIREDYKKYKFDILGPRIDTNNGESVNPFPVFKTLEEVEEQIKYREKLVKIYSNPMLNASLCIYMGLKRVFVKPRHLVNGEHFEEDVALHGCAIIFSKKYYERYKNIFYNETFLYHEEEFIYQRVLRDKLKSIYDPELSIFHKEGASLNMSFGTNERKKLIFRNKEIIKSLKLLKNVIEEGKDE
jgi:GT2 family glycosyltransferase